jgi:hypothetical protein
MIQTQDMEPPAFRSEQPIINFKNDQKLLILSSALPLMTLPYPKIPGCTMAVTAICIFVQ